MDIFDVLLLIGGLALFLYGMTEMGNGLERASGGKLKSILEKLTSSKIKGVLLGAGVTGVIQSSSATTVMVVGLVNSSIMTLSQAIPVVMGANIGTTVTGWILSLTGIQSDNIIVNLFKPSSFAPILAIIGIGFIMFSKNAKKKDIGTIFLGFTVLMLGMDLMSDAVAPLANVPQFGEAMVKFTNPVLGVIVGALITALIQSSSASVGILQALALTGLVSYGAALPIIMGQNIGTCITAILAGIGANKNAKRVSVVHLSFNTIGSVLFLLVFYGLNVFLQFDFLGKLVTPVSIALIHTTFNLVSTVIFLPLTEQFKKLAVFIIKDDEEEQYNEFQILEPRFIESPGYAVNVSKDMTDKMARISQSGFLKAISLLENYDSEIAKAVEELENRVDRYEDEIGSYLLKIGAKELTRNDSRMNSFILHSLGEYERISDLSVNIMKAAKELDDKGLSFSKNAIEELKVLIRAVSDVLDLSISAAKDLDVSKGKKVEPLEEVIDSLNKELHKRHIKRLRDGTCSVECGFILSDITTSLERISDHCSNIALYIIQLSSDEMDIHEYIYDLKHKEKDKFYEEYKLVKKQYKLPQIYTF